MLLAEIGWRTMSASDNSRLNISVVVPVRNAESLIESCLQSVRRNRPAEVIVVDGESEDGTIDRARAYADAILSDRGQGVAYARNLGAEAASSPYVAFVDVDVELPNGALADLADELTQADADAVQAQLSSVDSGDYWSWALAAHHSGGRSKRWFGLVCTIFRREWFLEHRLDLAFRTGEDIELRHRLQKAGARILVSERVAVIHRFQLGLVFALGQWLADGAGLGRTLRKHRIPVLPLAFLPAAGTVLGLLRSWRRLHLVPYYILYGFFNYVGLVQGLLDGRVSAHKRAEDHGAG